MIAKAEAVSCVAVAQYFIFKNHIILFQALTY
jgi:hypothetical protein